MNSNYLAVDHESNNPHLYETPYNTYSPYPDYTGTSKLEAFDYNYWPPTTNPIIDPIQASPSIESSLHLSQINSTRTISATHHHHHIHQHLYPPTISSNDPSNWIASTEYPSPAAYRHYTYPNNNFYDQSQWTTPTSSIPIKFETPYSPSPHNLGDSKEEPSDSSYSKCQEEELNWFNPVPPKNPINGKTRTRDKYRIVYTDRQRYELENEFSTSKYISIPRKAALSSSLGLSERQIKIWFQNRRAKERKVNKKRQEICSRKLNNSNDPDSLSEDGLESPIYYQNYA